MKKIALTRIKDRGSSNLEEADAVIRVKGETGRFPRVKPERPADLALLDFVDISDIPTTIIPAIEVERFVSIPQKSEEDQKITESEIPTQENRFALLRKFATSSSVYALSSMAIPLIGLVLSPFLTSHLSLEDYGTLAIINTAIGLFVGLTQLNLSAAIVRAYIYDYSTERDRNAVIVTASMILCFISFMFEIFVASFAPQLSRFLLGSSAFSLSLVAAGGVVVLQNLTVPGLSLMRSENRPFLYSLLSISNLLVTLFTTIFLVGLLHEGVTGAIIANGLGYACIVICTLPVIFLRKGIKIRFDIAKSMLAYGLPLIINFVSYWILQLLDRYLLSLFGSLEETAKYTIAYILGSVISVVIISPFTLAWPTIMFSVAKQKDGAQTFQLIFRWLGMILLFAAFALSFASTVILDVLFPASYRSAASVIPFIAAALVFYGIYYMFMLGANIHRKTWLAGVFMTTAAVVNVVLNLILIPLFGAQGAAAATLVGYAVLALVAYIVNQKIYPVPFEVGRFICGLFVGIGLYSGCWNLSQNQGIYAGWGIYLGGLLLYAVCLVFLGKLLPPMRQPIQKRTK